MVNAVTQSSNTQSTVGDGIACKVIKPLSGKTSNFLSDPGTEYEDHRRPKISKAKHFGIQTKLTQSFDSGRGIMSALITQIIIAIRLIVELKPAPIVLKPVRMLEEIVYAMLMSGHILLIVLPTAISSS